MTDERSREIAWHTLAADAALETLGSETHGLSDTEAARRLARHGENRLTPAKRRGPLQRFAAQFHNVLIYVLLLAAGVTALLGHAIDTAVILAVVVINAFIGFIQEGRAEKALASILRMLSQKATVRRDGRVLSIAAESLVAGDVVLLQPGDKIPADARLFRARNLKVDEAILTGESLPVDKTTAAVEYDTALGDRRGMVFSGTLVVARQGEAVVTATGDDTEIGRISGLLREVETLVTPLLRQIARFARLLSAVILALAVALVAFGVFARDYSWTEMFLASVSLAVAAIPEGLPAIMTIALAVGVQRMAGRRAIIRRLPAVETLGALTVICSDKTGTFTRNEMTVQAIRTADGETTVSGRGYDPHGGLHRDGEDLAAAEAPSVMDLVRAGMLCNDAEIRRENDQWIAVGDPTEAALITLGMKAGLDPARQAERYPRLDVIPFESESRYMATLNHDHEGHVFVYAKGGPERILDMCSQQLRDGRPETVDRAYWQQRMEALAGRGFRVLGLAFKGVAPETVELEHATVETGMTFLGLVGMIDPPRRAAIEAVADCRAAGIRVTMITGDHPLTAVAIARQLGLENEAVLTGPEIERLDDRELRDRVGDTRVFARASPEHKLRLVQALQANGEVVAMTGDGVNDAPALRRADVGIAMGIKGTDVAKEAAELVLADDDFATIGAAVAEGRTVHDNLKKAIAFILPTNGGEALTLMAAIAAGRMLPITPVQILWVNMVTAVTLALVLAFEPAERNVMSRPPRDPDEPLLSRFLAWRIVFVSLILVTGTYGLFVWERTNGAGIEEARTVAVNTLVLFEIFYLFSARFLHASAFSPGGLTGNRYLPYAIGALLALQLAFTYLPPMQALFHTRPFPPERWLAIVAVASSVFFLVELERVLVHRHRSMHPR